MIVRVHWKGTHLKNNTFQLRATLLVLHAQPTQLNNTVKVHHNKLLLPANKKFVSIISRFCEHSIPVKCYYTEIPFKIEFPGLLCF